MSDCDPIRELLLDGASPDDESAAHIASCESCSALSEALGGVAHEMTAFESLAAPEALVARTIERVQSLDSQPEPNVFSALVTQLGRGWMTVGKLLWMPFAALSRLRGPRLAIAVPALCGMLLVALTVTTFGVMDQGATPSATSQTSTLGPNDPFMLDSQDTTLGYINDGVAAGEDFVPSEDPASIFAYESEISGLPDTSGCCDDDGDFGGQNLNGLFEVLLSPRAPVDDANLRLAEGSIEQTAPSERSNSAFHSASDHASGLSDAPVSSESEGERLGRTDHHGRTRDDHGLERSLRSSSREEESTERGQGVRGGADEGRDADSWRGLDDEEDEEDGRQGLNWLGRDEISGLTYRSPTGRWANTYVPGDPRWRLLARRLRRTGNDTLAGVGVSAFELAQQAQSSTPRIAAPGQSALALSVQSDRARVEGQTRVLMQIGLRGAAVRGRRPILRSVVVLDLSDPLDEAGRANVRSLLASISRARAGADRIGIIVAGPHGGTLVEPGSLRLGEVTVALRHAFSNEGGEATTLRGALASAIRSVSLSDADSPLGSGLVWLVTPGLDPAQVRSLESVAHTGALAGVTTTTIGLSSDVDGEPLESVALAGHGRRWVIDAQPERIVRQEIEAASRVVARAVRLNIRLARGTRLVGVLGSRSLSELEAERTAAAERSIDQQLASRLGIASDRERDDDGIQIVIPAFYADDTHTILLDLVVEGPGPVADVSVRYKDLLRLDNGESNERPVLPRGRTERGPRQRDVLRSWLAHELSVSLRRAAAQVSSSRPAALAELRRARERLENVRTSLRALASDRQLVQQAELCQRFEAALQGSAAPAVLADSLRIASRRLVFGDPLSTGERSPR